MAKVKRVFQRVRKYVEEIILEVEEGDPIEQTIAEAQDKPDSEYFITEKHISKAVFMRAITGPDEPAHDNTMLLKTEGKEGWVETEVVQSESVSPSLPPVDDKKTKKGKP